MSKAAVLGGTGILGTGAAAVTGAHYMGVFGGSDNYKVSTTTAQIANYNGQCLDKTFGQSEWEITRTVPEFTKKTILLNGNSKGCLAINWNKEKKPTGDWGGNFRFIWSFLRGSGGFVVYLSGTTEAANDGKVNMNFEGVVYDIDWFKEGGEDSQKGKWKPKEQLSLQNEKIKLTSSELSTKFPVLSEILKKTKDGLDDRLNFLDSSGTKVEPLKEGESAYRYAQWEFKHEGNDPLDPWKKETLSKWWGHFFDQSKWDLKDTVSNIKGKWELRAISG